MRRWLVGGVGLVVIAAAVLAACGGEEEEAPPPSPGATGQAADGAVTIEGVVQDVARSARVITLEESVQGFTTVAIEDDTTFALTSGEPATFEEVAPGDRIQASGRSGTPGTVIASVVVIFAPVTPTPLPESPTGEADPTDFEAFADLIAGAAASGDTDFFAGRIEPEPYTCTEAEITDGGPGGAEPGLCEEAGQELDLVLECFWQSECVHVLPERLASDIEDYFARVLPDQEDTVGTGELRLLATAVPKPGMYEARDIHAAVLTAISAQPGTPNGQRFRTALGIDFEYVEGRWVIRRTLSAGFPEPSFFDDFLSPENGLYMEMEVY